MTSYLSAVTLASYFNPTRRLGRAGEPLQSSAILKRAVDLLGLALLAPFALLIALLVILFLWGQGGAVFYSQMRIGHGGKPFRLWKFRTMRPDAETVFRAYLARNPAAAEEWVSTGKLRFDPRIRRGGYFLRLMSVDELPQLWNVARGEMSLVGPRPVLRCELNHAYGSAAGAYKSCLPGLSGLWQVSGRNRLNYEQRVALDCHYAKHRSLGMDLWIMGRTLGAVLRGSGC